MSGNERHFAKIAGIPLTYPIPPQAFGPPLAVPPLAVPSLLSIQKTPVRGNPITLSQLRRRVNVLKRKFAPELAIIRLRRIAEAVSDDWDPSESLEPTDVIAHVAKAGFRLPTLMRLRHETPTVPRRHHTPGGVPESESIVLDLLPWAWKDRYRAFLRWDLPAPPQRG